MGFLSSANCSVYWLLLTVVAIASSVEQHSSILGIGRIDEIGTLSVSRGIRQTNLDEAKVCSQILYRTQCTGGYTQNFINTLSRCSSAGLASAVAAEMLCRQNANGDYCGTIGVDIANILDANQICTSSCSSSCRSALLSLSNRHGCCLTSNPLLQLLPLLSHFISCGISLPGSCDETNLNVPSATTVASCDSATESLRATLSFSCTRQNIQPILDALRENNCDTFAQLNEIGCGFRNGRFCYENFLTTDTSIRVAGALTDATGSCLSESTCSSPCASSISTLNEELGCCINLYNSSLLVYQTTSAGGDLSLFSTITSNNLWSECGVTPPGICQTRLTDSAISFDITYCFIFLMLIFSLLL